MRRDFDLPMPAGLAALPASLSVPAGAIGLVVFVHGSGSSRQSPRNIAVADHLNERGLATVLFDLLTESEARDRRNVFDIPLLASRVRCAAEYLAGHPDTAGFGQSLFGASTGAAAALVAAAALGDRVKCIVSRGGRPDLAASLIRQVAAPTLLIVGSLDHDVLALNREALRLLNPHSRLLVIDGATHLFEEPGAMHEVARRSADWFVHHFTARGEPAVRDDRR
jgi:pimeloyl-ACP methyl ester carboxylesterase